MTDDPASAGALAAEMIARGVDVAMYSLAMETFYFRSANPPPTFWTKGYDYALDMEAYTSEINAAYANAGLPTPTDFHQLFRPRNRVAERMGLGQDGLIDPNGDGTYGSDNKPGIGDYVLENGRTFTATDFHWYPGNPSTSILDTGLDAVTSFEMTSPIRLPNTSTTIFSRSPAPMRAASAATPMIRKSSSPSTTSRQPGRAPSLLSTRRVAATRRHSSTRHAHGGFHSLTAGCLDSFALASRRSW